MRTTQLRKHFTAVLGALIVLSLMVTPATANHTWGSYHLSRTTVAQELKVVDNLTTDTWHRLLQTTVNQWKLAGADRLFNLQVYPGGASKNCKPVAGTIQVCNATYGNTGWLGIAQIWLSGGHISQGTSKQNDTYFNQARYNTDAWRLMVICQEVAHTFGLGHVNEDNTDPNTGSCMDYTNDPDGLNNNIDAADANTHPNQHDIDVLTTITHVQGTSSGHPVTTTTKSTGLTRAEEAVTSSDSRAWGRVTETDPKGKPTRYELDLGNNESVVTFVIPVDESEAAPVDDGTGGGRNDGGRDGGGKQDGAKQDGGRDDGGKRDGARQDGGRDDGGKRDGARQRQGDRDQHRHR